eukprot:5323815-Pyramimonas_sp.AAC.1
MHHCELVSTKPRLAVGMGAGAVCKQKAGASTAVVKLRATSRKHTSASSGVSVPKLGEWFTSMSQGRRCSSSSTSKPSSSKQRLLRSAQRLRASFAARLRLQAMK